MEYIVLLIFFALSLAGIGLGSLVGIRYRKHLLKNIRQNNTIIPIYELSQQLNPLEFEALCTGNVTVNGLIGFVVKALMDEQATVDTDGKIVFTTIPEPHSRIIQIIKPMVLSRSTAATLSPLIFESLASRGWLIPDNGEVERSNQKHSILGLIVVSVSLIAGLVGIICIAVAPPTNEQLQTTGVIIALFGVFGILFSIVQISFTRYFARSFLQASRIARKIVPEKQPIYQQYLVCIFTCRFQGLIR